jgi:glycosyl transferase family 25
MSPVEAFLTAFERIYVINLPERKDRRTEIAAQLSRVGLDLSHPAVSLVEAERPEDAGDFPTIGARGCFASHLKVHARALEDGAARYLVLEDDADFCSDFPIRIGPFADALMQGGWGMVYGWAPGAYGVSGGPGDAKIVDIAPEEEFCLSHFIGFTREAGALALPYLRAIYERPFNHPDGGAMHVDGAYNWFRAAHPRLRVCAPRYTLAIQRPSRSDVQAQKWFDRLPVTRPAVDSLRRARKVLRR